MPEAERVVTEMLPGGFQHAVLRFGFAEKPDMPAALRAHRAKLGFGPDEASFSIGKEVPVSSVRPDLSGWQAMLFTFLTRNAVRADDYFLIPPERMVELGTRVEL